MTQQRKGFTLLEALVASVILGGAVVGIGTISTRCLDQARLSREYDTAWRLLDRQLTIIDYMGLDAFLREGVTDGEIDDFGPRYHWRVEVRKQETGDLHLVSIALEWADRARPYKVSLSTLLNSATELAMGVEEEEPEPESAPEGDENG